MREIQCHTIQNYVGIYVACPANPASPDGILEIRSAPDFFVVNFIRHLTVTLCAPSHPNGCDPYIFRRVRDEGASTILTTQDTAQP